jgi:hypothetical protein
VVSRFNAIYRAYDDLEQMVNLVLYNKFDLERGRVSASSYLTKIIVESLIIFSIIAILGIKRILTRRKK